MGRNSKISGIILKVLIKLDGFLHFCGKAFTKLHLFVFSFCCFKLKDFLVLHFIEYHYGDFINLLSQNLLNEECLEPKNLSKLPIWVCWLQGEENAPVLVQRCISSIRKNSGQHPVIILTNDNIPQYVEIPEPILEKVRAGILTYTNFSDVLRMALLKKYGGMWIDATFFLTQKIPEEYFKVPFFTLGKQKEPRNRRWVCISRYRWTSSYLAGWANNQLFTFVYELFIKYISETGPIIDYLLFDYFIYLAYIKLGFVKKEIDEVPYNNIHLHSLFYKLNNEYNKAEAGDMLLGDTLAFKLSYKRFWKEEKHGASTYYHNLIEQKEVFAE